MPQTPVFTVDYVPQREWGVGGRRLFIMLALYFGGIGAGLYLVSLLAGYPQAALLGIFIVGIAKSISHILFLGRPGRFWRAVWRPQSSWISRGLIFMVLFVLSGLGYLLPGYSAFTWLPWTVQGAFGGVLFWVSIVFAFLTIVYTGLALNRTAIPFWNQSLLPVLFLTISLATGATIAHLLLHLSPQVGVNVSVLNQSILWMGWGTLVLLFFYFWNAYTVNLASQRSVRYLTMEREGILYFYGLFLLLGFLFPLVVATINIVIEVNSILFVIASCMEIVIGALLFRYLILRGGIFAPIA
ncbi:NrfD/PsrC family molybdoenzyme membrane anchor subunit [Chloroflexota bacterium]